MKTATVKSDRDQRVAVGPHVLMLKKGPNEVPESLVEALVQHPGITAASAPKARSSQSGTSSG